MRRMGILVWGVCALLLLPISASALATYSYSGPDFTFVFDNDPPAGTFTTSMSVSGSFDLAALLGPNFALSDISGSVTAYSFTDGRTVFTDVNSSITLFNVETDGSGDISDWSISFDIGVPVVLTGDVQRSLGSQFTSDFGNVTECLTDNGSSCTSSAADNGLVNSPGAGVWSVVPEPASASLLALGLVGLVLQRRRPTA